MSEQKSKLAPAENHGTISPAASSLTMERLEYKGFNTHTGEFLYRCSFCGANMAVSPMEVFPPQRRNDDAHLTDGITGKEQRNTASVIWWVSAWWIFYFLLVFFSVPILNMVLS